ncbi:hypothetical protein [Streptomyces sp. NPDC048590]|uniref:hypothetical protein n=1 Tax=Streptomyces sp. NPDC048590 TaxID=3365574 RepID=UPI0037216D83
MPNLLLGIPAVVPFWLLWYLAAIWVSGPPAEENDGTAPVLVVVVTVVGLYALLWSAVNRHLSRRSPLTGRTYWLLSALGTLLPTAALIILYP